MSFAQALDSETLFAYAIAAMFASLLPAGLVGALVGRLYGAFEAGLATAMVLFGSGALVLGSLVGWVLWQSDEVEARRTTCLPLPAEAGDTVARHRDVYTGSAQGVSRRFATPPVPGPCPEPAAEETDEAETADAPPPPQTLRVRRAAWQDGADPLPAEVIDDPRQAPVMVGVFGAFGGFWLLAGLTLAASRREQRRLATRPPGADLATPVGPRRRALARLATLSGNLVFVGCAGLAAFADWDAQRATIFAFHGVAVACALYAVAMALKRTLSLSTALTLLIIGGGFALAAWSLRVLG